MLGLVLVSGRAPPRVSYRGSSVAACPCGVAAADVMRAAGMTVLAPETPAQWRVHMAQEDGQGGLFDLLLEAGADPSDVSRLRAEHAFYEVLLDAGKPLPAGNESMSVDAHGALEDGLCYAYRNEILGAGDAEGGGVRTSGLSGGESFDKLSSDLYAAASKDAADRAKRTAETNKQLDDWGKAVDSVIPGAGTWLASTSKLALSAEGTIVRWVQGDWDSDEQKARALSEAKKSIEDGIPPRSFNAEIDFAKTYADSTAREYGRTYELGAPYQAVFDDYRKSLLANAGNDLIDSAFVRAAGSFSEELGPELLCHAIESGGPYVLANLLAAVASARYGTPLSQSLQTAYAALAKLVPSHPTICSGRGYKGGSSTWDYDHGPALYVLQAWLDLSPKAHADVLLGKAPASSDPYAGKMTTSSSSALPWLFALTTAGWAVWRWVL